MKNTRLIFVVIFSCTLLLFSCGKGKVTYEEGFPTGDSPALMEFMRYELLTSTGTLLYKDEVNNIYVERNLNSEPKTLNYFTNTDELLKQHYEPMLQEKDSKKLFRDLILSVEGGEDLQNPIKGEVKASLPKISMKKDNKLEIKTLENEKTFDLPMLLSDYEMKRSDSIIFNLIAENEEHFHIYLDNRDAGDSDNQLISLFMNQDLSDMVITKASPVFFQETYSAGQLKEYDDLFTKVDPQGRFRHIYDDDYIMDNKTNQILFLNDTDYQSRNGKYVYLNGAEKKLTDGTTQKIQTIENYLEGNEIYESEFKISFKKIAKKAGIKMHGVSIAKIVYFNEDYVVLSLNYKGFIVGEAGFTNVIIDLQEDKNNPKAYVVDLDIIL